VILDILEIQASHCISHRAIKFSPIMLKTHTKTISIHLCQNSCRLNNLWTIWV